MMARSTQPIIFLFLIGALFGALFHSWPQLDLEVSSHFYRLEQGGFHLEFAPWPRGIYLFVSDATRVMIVGMIVLFLAQLIVRRTCWVAGEKLLRPCPPMRVMVYLMAALIIGPGIGVHYVIKDEFERPRPREILQFGGTQEHAPLFTIGKDRGKSFVSGHASMGFYLTAFALLLRGRKRAIVYMLAVMAGVGIGAVRVIQGGHFVSDVVFAGIFILMVNHLCYAALRTWESRCEPRIP